MITTVRSKVRAGAALLALAAMSSAQAIPVIANGGFESGFASWSRADQLGSDGGFFIQGATASPRNADLVPAPSRGAAAAMSDGFAPGSHVLYQDFVATADNAVLSFDLFIGNRAGSFATPASLDFALTNQAGAQTLNQQARVDLLRAGADPFSVAAGDVLLTLYRSQVGDPLVGSGYRTITSDITAVLAANSGQSLRLRFAETDNVAQFQMGIDNVVISAVPEPASTLLLGSGLAGLLAWRASGRLRDRKA